MQFKLHLEMKRNRHWNNELAQQTHFPLTRQKSLKNKNITKLQSGNELNI